MVSRDIIQRLLAIINETRSRVNTLESKENVLLTATQTLTNKTLTTPTIGSFTNAQHAHTGAASGGTIAHTSLTALTTGDPHTQYALLAGRSGGQSLSGGTAANDDLTLQGTTNATRTTSYVIMQPNGGTVGIGDTNPSYKLRIKETISGAGGIYVSTTSGTAQQPSFYFDDTAGSSISDFEIYLDATNVYVGPYLNKGLQFVKNAGVDKTMVITNQGNVGIGTTGPGRKLHVAGTIIVDGDEGGIAGTVGFTDVSDLAARSTGVGTIKFDDGTNRDSSGFIKIYIGTTAYYVPVFAAI
jgi:hypothetical protein